MDYEDILRESKPRGDLIHVYRGIPWDGYITGAELSRQVGYPLRNDRRMLRLDIQQLREEEYPIFWSHFGYVKTIEPLIMTACINQQIKVARATIAGAESMRKLIWAGRSKTWYDNRAARELFRRRMG
jgi:hypothetical protein